MRAPTRLASGLELTEAEVTAGRQRLAAVGTARAARDGHAIGAASFTLERLLAGDLDPASERGQASIRAALALVAVLHERPTRVETVAARLAEAEDTAAWMEENAPERAERFRARAGSLRGELAVLEVRIARAAKIEAERAHPKDAAAETPADVRPESSLAPVDPDSPAGRVAVQLAEEIGEHLSSFSIGRPQGALVANVAPGAEVEHLRAVAAAFPDAKVWADGTSSRGIFMVIVEAVRDGVAVQISAVLFPRQVEEQAAARAWMAERAAEVGAR
ncbi:hypothetical protein I6A60_31230 [Frankia sp. AgB1.9]|uniref:hypothetical protein n=1 Tax=unclassified Frankia TaxID=2632575 RepID=UPI001931794C|nr:MULTISPECIES: hypothetical protein [unclassified Frankia]MBL7493018.1 hypothetical protein [Frankia sp. AgW1.1]MBL7552303.1 hypothetical protein [Frankia sp. AgB1.9]MBL7622056.1 hypothetical protein [Frankia sp. AgB1.8]